MGRGAYKTRAEPELKPWEDIQDVLTPVNSFVDDRAEVGGQDSYYHVTASSHHYIAGLSGKDL